MMTRTPSQKRMLLKYLSVLPFILVVSLVFTNQKVQAEISKVEEIDLEGMFGNNSNPEYELLLEELDLFFQNSGSLINNKVSEICYTAGKINRLFLNNRTITFEPKALKHKTDGSVLVIEPVTDYLQFTLICKDQDAVMMNGSKLESCDLSGLTSITNSDLTKSAFSDIAVELNKHLNKISILNEESIAQLITTAYNKYLYQVTDQDVYKIGFINWCRQNTLSPEFKGLKLTTIKFPIDQIITKHDITWNPISGKKLKILDSPKPFPLTIYNQYGEEIYKNEQYSNNWNGEFSDVDIIKDGNYFYRSVLAEDHIVQGALRVDNLLPGNVRLMADVNPSMTHNDCLNLSGDAAKECFSNKRKEMWPNKQKYPEAALRDRAEGLVALDLIIEKDGSISEITANTRFGRSYHPALEKAAIERMKKSVKMGFRYTPALVDGKPVKFRTGIAYPFELPDQYSIITDTLPQKQLSILLRNIKTGQTREKKINLDSKWGAVGDTIISYDPKTYKETIEVIIQAPSTSREVFKIVEEKPEFPGGQEALFKYIFQQLKYPEIARKNGVEGNAIIGFVIEADGSITNTRIRRDPGAGLGAEALRVINLMAKAYNWNPGKQRGKNVAVAYNIPIRFKLDKKVKEDTKENAIDITVKSNPVPTFSDHSQNDTIITYDPVTYEETITVKKKLNTSIIPAAFNPIIGKLKLNTMEPVKFEVFNRWGNLVFSSPEYKDNWDGKWNGDELPEGTYFGLVTNKEANIKESGYIVINRITKSNSNDNPLIVIFNDNDEVVYNLDGLNADIIRPNDIAKINILKGDSATEQYGNRGTNGVIEIYMKPGKVDSPKELMSKSKSTADNMGFDSIKIFPNPVSNELSISFEGLSERSDLLIYSIDGKVLLRKSIDTDQSAKMDLTTTHDISNLPNGVLIISIIQGNKVYSQPIVKK